MIYWILVLMLLAAPGTCRGANPSVDFSFVTNNCVVPVVAHIDAETRTGQQLQCQLLVHRIVFHQQNLGA